MADSSRPDSTPAGEATREKTPNEPARLPALPSGYSRVDALPDEFAAFLARRPLLPGDTIANHYRLIERLGDGAMGEVFIAENLAIGRRVAVKVLRPEMLLDAEFRRRFQHEAEAIAAIDHRNVVRFLDLLVGDPTFLVMEYAPGPTLADVLGAEKRLELTRALNIARRLCWALEASHRAGVVHRDIKPSNVILTPDPELGEEPKLIDFGLAKLVTLAPEKALTRTGQILGTPHYMSPEQVANQPVDARSDVYSLGCLLQHLLTGRPPFDQGDEVQILYAHLHLPPAPLRALLPEAPKILEEILTRALAKDPAARFASMRELVEALGRVERRRGAPAAAPRSALRPTAMVVTGLLVLSLVLWGLRAIAPGTQLLVTTSPPGATVEIDGHVTADKSPLALPADAGRHVVKARLLGHAAAETVATVERGQRLAVHLTLPQASRDMQLSSVPSGAQLFVDGQLFGHTPLAVSISEDDFHEFRVEKPGYETLLKAITPDDKSPSLTLQLQPERQPRGTLWIDANRASSVFLDGNDTGLVTPTIGLRVAPGPHRVELRDASGERGPSAQVHLNQGEIRHLTLDFAR
jgi:tRNA A-37 threonylcarbamoyl transferase component Bud32